MIAGLQIELAADQVHLLLLRPVEIVGARVVPAGVVLVPAEELAEEIVIEVVVPLGDAQRALARLVVAGAPEERGREVVEAPEAPLQPAVEEPISEILEIGAAPPPVHVGLAEAERSLEQRLAVKGRVMDDDVPGPPAVGADVDGAEDSVEEALGQHPREDTQGPNQGRICAGGAPP